MGFGCLIAGFIILFNPVIHVVDILPDAIGFFLIVVGLTKMSFFIGKTAQARDLFIKLALLETVKFVSVLIIPYTSGTTKTLLSMVFGVAELLMFIPAVNYMFDGLSFAGMWYNGTAMYEPKKTKLKKRANAKTIDSITYVRDYIIFFYIFRVCATTIPELTELEMYNNLGEVSAFSRSLTSTKPYLYVLLGIITLVFGIMYIRRVSRFFKSVRKDEQFIANLNSKYEQDILPRETFFIARNMKRAMAFFIAAAATSFVMSIDDVNLMVGAISAGCLIAASVIVGKYVKQARIVIPIAAVRGALAIVNMIVQFNYFSEYSVDAVHYIDNAYTLYYRMATLECVEYVLAAISMILFMLFLVKAVKQHLAICGIQSDNAMYSKQNHDIETYNTVGGKILMCSVLTAINFILAASYHFILVSMSLIVLINSVVTIIWIIYIMHTVSVVNNMLYNKELDVI